MHPSRLEVQMSTLFICLGNLLSNEASEARKGMLEARSDGVKSPSWSLIKSCMIAGRSQALNGMLVFGALSLAGKMPRRRERVHCPRQKRLRRFICGGYNVRGCSSQACAGPVERPTRSPFSLKMKMVRTWAADTTAAHTLLVHVMRRSGNRKCWL